ncbi:MAG TPA: energy-coupling factor transporter transmembrane component T [Candidatus Eisenbacteria bacterium]|nr:energy-coupling factor transporter transmembrane component T [Candidatus Eisenbacteria bacterium]
MPGSPERNESTSHPISARPRHPAALLAFALAAGAGISFARAPILLAVTAVVFAAMALRSEGKRPRAELPFLGLALVLFLAHAILARFAPAATVAAALLALRLLALVYLTRWAVKTFLPGAAQWLLEQPIPTRPRPLALAVESARLSTALLPIAAKEAEAQTLALRARGIRAGRGFTGRARFTAAWLLPFLGTMLRVGDALADALHARGYRPGARRVGLARAPWAWADAGVILLGVVIAGALVRGF